MSRMPIPGLSPLSVEVCQTMRPPFACAGTCFPACSTQPEAARKRQNRISRGDIVAHLQRGFVLRVGPHYLYLKSPYPAKNLPDFLQKDYPAVSDEANFPNPQSGTASMN